MPRWTPDLASQPLEELMEAKNLPEEDRDEVRRFAEFLQRRKDVREGKTLPPAPDGMRDWLLGKE
jgi:hypothetical protein